MVKSTRQKHARNQEYRSFANVSADFSASTARKLSLSALTTVLTAATCLGGQPILASSNILLPPTTAAFAEEVRDANTTPWLHTPNILEYQRYRYLNSKGDFGYVGDDQVGDWDRIINKTDMYAHVKDEGNNKYLVFDVFFNNDGKSMLSASKKHQYVWQIPYAIADLSNGGYKNDTMRNLRFDFYKRNNRSPQTYANLSHDIGLFEPDASKSFNQDFLHDSQDHNNSTYHYSIGVRPGRPGNQDIKDNFHVNPDALDSAIKKALPPDQRPYNGYNYGIGITTTHVDYAVRMHCELKLRPGVTDEEIKNAFTWANSSSYGRTTHSAYTFISGRTKDENVPPTKSDKIPPKLYLNGKEISDSNNSIDVYQGESPKIIFGTSDNSEKVTKFSVSGFPDSINKANFTEDKADGFDATEKNPHKHEINGVKFEYKNGNTPANTNYTVTVSATDASGNKAEKTITVHLKNQNLKHKAPTTTPITVDWGHKPTADELNNHVSGADGGTLTFDSIPETKLPDIAFNGKDTAPAYASGKVTYSDGSYHNVTVPVHVKKPLSLQHKSELKNHTVEVSVKDELTKTKDGKVDAKEYLGKLNDATKKKITKAEWVNDEPSTDVAGKRTYTAKVTFNDGSTAEEKVTFTVRPQKPTIETDLTGVAGVKGKEVVVNAGPGTEGSTVTLKDNGKKVIGTGKVGADGKVTIKVADGIPAGNVTAVTSTNPADPTKEQSVQSPVSDPKNATKDDKAPTLTGPENVTVKVGEDLKIELTAKDDVKIDDFNIAAPLLQLVNNDFSRLKIEYQGKQDDPKNRKVKITILGMKESEIGEHELKFSVTDAAGNKVEKTVKVTVKKKEELKSRTITVDLKHTLNEEDAQKAIASGKKLKRAGATFKWSNETGGTPDTSTVGKEKDGTVIVTIPTNDPNNPRVETVKVKVTVKDSKKPEVVIQQKDGNSYKGIDIKTESESGGKISTQIATITTYRGDKNDIKIAATDNSGEVTTLTLTPTTPGETEKDPTGTGTADNPKTLTLDGTTPLNIEPRTYTRTLKAVDPSGNTNEVTVKFIVKPQADKYSKVTGTPVTYNMSSGTTHPDPKSGINATDLKKLPSDATYSWVNEPDWNKPGEQNATVRITFKDGSTKDVTTTVTVKDNIAPVINTPNTNKAKRADTEQAEYYQFKVHNGKQFNIDINAYDNSGKIKSATLSMPEEITGSKISITDKDNNSAEKPAKITITGTAHRANNTNPDANKWSRELSVTDEAGNTSKLKVQISVYTDAEEHDATAKQVDKNNGDTITEQDITNAITITDKYPKEPKITPTFTVTKPLPESTATGMHTVPVTVKYPDGSTTVVDVPVKIGSAAKAYDPQGNTITVPWHSKEDLAKKIQSFGDGNGLKWNGNSPASTPKVEIVNKDVPNTDKPGESQVQVEVKYKDGSSDVATVTVKVLDPQNKDYTPEGKTINIAYNKTPNTSIKNNVETNGVKLKKNGETTYLTNLPDGASIAVDDNNTVPNGTQPGDFNVPVTITYKDGSKDHATVKVTVGKPQSETHTPKVDGVITKKYGENGPSKADIIAKVTVPNKPTTGDTTITVDNDQTPIDTKTPGIVNVKVTVTYPDGSEDHVEVPVTVGEPDNVTHKASATPIELHKNDAQPTEQQIKDKVNTGVGTGEDQPTITVDKDKIPKTNQTGTTNVPVTITYKDETSTTVQVPVIVKDWNKDEYPPSAEPVEEPYDTSKEKTKEDVKKAVTVDLPEEKKKDLTFEIVDEKTIPSGTEPGTKTVKVKVTYPDTSTKEVTVDVTIKDKQSDTFEPTATPVVKQYGKKVTSEDVTKNVTVPGWPENKKNNLKIELNDHNKALPDGKTPGNSTVKVKVTYPDGTTDTVDVPVTISNKQSELYPPKADSITKKNGEKTSKEEIIGKVSVPTWPDDKKDKPNYSISKEDAKKIPTGDKAGKFEVPVTVTYPDESTTVINVPVTINAPKPEAKTGVTVPKGVDPKPEDSIANKDKFPDGTIFEWTEKPDTSEEGNNKSGKVKITIPGSTTQEVPVKVNVVDPGAPQINVPQGTDLPKPEDVIKDPSETNKYPSGTTFTWKPEDTPDTNNPGTQNGVIIVTLPGQKPVEVPVTVNVTPNPETNVVNVKVGDNLPDASKGIANKDKFPNGTTFEWKDGGPKTNKSGTTNGTVLIHVPGVKNPVEATVTVNVNPAPNGKETTVIQNSDPDPKNSIDNSKDLPNGTIFEWKKGAAPKTDKQGTTKGTVIVKIPGQEPQEVTVKITVTASPEGKDVTVLQKTGGKDNTPQAKDVIKNHSDLPKDAKTSWTKKPDTSHVGNQPSVVTITVPGMTPVDVPVNVLVVPNPEGKTVSVPVGANPKPEDSIANNGDFPDGTTFEWEKDDEPKTDKQGTANGTVLVKIPGLKEPVKVQVTLNVTDKPFINDRKAENTPDKPNKTTITGKGTPGATITVQDNSGNALKDENKEITVTVDKGGNFTVDVPKQIPGTTLKLVPSKDNKSGTPAEVTVIAKPKAPTITVPSENKDGKTGEGDVTVTPTKDDSATVVTIVITAKPNPLNGPEQPVRTIIAKKDNNGKWKIDGNAPEGVNVDPKTGAVTIPAKDLEDGSTITAVAKDNNDNPSDKAEKTTGFKTPQITEQSIADAPNGGGSGDSGNHEKQVITGKTDIPGATITVTDNNGKQIGTGVADKDGNFTITINKQTPGSIVNLTPTKGTGDFAKTGNTVEVTVGGDIAVPRIDTPADGSATITPNLTDTRVDKVVITYTPEGDGSTPQTVTITVIAEGDMRVWKIDGPAPSGVTVDPNTGVVTIPATNVKDGSTITAVAKNSTDNNTAEGSSSTVTGTIAQPGGSGSGSDDGSDSGESDSGTNESGSHTNNGSNANNTNNANKNGNKNDVSGHNGGNNHGNQSRNSGSNSESRRGKGALGNTGVGVALSALASAMLAGMGAAGRAVSRRKKRNQLARAK